MSPSDPATASSACCTAGWFEGCCCKSWSARRVASSAPGACAAAAAPPDFSIWNRAPMALEMGSAMPINCWGTLGSDWIAPSARARASRADFAAETGSDMSPPDRLAYHQVAATCDDADEPPRVEQLPVDFAPQQLDRPVARADHGVFVHHGCFTRREGARKLGGRACVENGQNLPPNFGESSR